jgi:simple sugar transport system permease protein
MLSHAFSTAGNACWALFRGSVFDPALRMKITGYMVSIHSPETARCSNSFNSDWSFSCPLAFRAGLFNIGAQGQFSAGAIGARLDWFHI